MNALAPTSFYAGQPLKAKNNVNIFGSGERNLRRLFEKSVVELILISSSISWRTLLTAIFSGCTVASSSIARGTRLQES